MSSLVSFLSENVFIIVLIVFSLVSFLVRFKNKNRALLEVHGDSVAINVNPALLFSLETQNIKTNSVVRVEIVGNRLSFFQKTGNAIDVWIHRKHLDKEIGNAKRIFTHAEFIKIDS